MRLKSLAFAAGVASMALVASGAAFAQSNGASEASAMTNDVSNFLGRVVMGKNDQLLGVIFQTQEAGNSSTVYLYTTTNLGLKGKVVTLPASMFAKQASEIPFSTFDGALADQGRDREDARRGGRGQRGHVMAGASTR